MVNCINIFIRVKSTLDCFRVLIGVCQVYFFRDSAIGFIDFLYDLYFTDCSFTFLFLLFIWVAYKDTRFMFMSVHLSVQVHSPRACVKRPEVDIKVSFPIALHFTCLFLRQCLT